MFAIYIVGADYYLGTVNLETGEVTAVGLFTSPAHIYTLAVDAEGTIYGIGYEDGVLYDIDPETACLLYTSPSPRDSGTSRMPSSA